MKKGIVLLLLVCLLAAMPAFATDQRIQYTEQMVGASHPTKSDTLNRLTLIEHNTDGTHKSITLNGKRLNYDDNLTFSGAYTATFALTGTTSLTLPTSGTLATTGSIGTLGSQNADNASITGGSITGLSTPLPIASGGTGAASASSARTNLGLGTGDNATLNSLALTTPLPVTSGGTGTTTGVTAPATSMAWKNSLNLKAFYASTSTVTVTADEVILPDNTSGRKGKIFFNVNVTPSMSTAGCNGFDNGTPADVASTWYHIWLMGHDNGTICGLLSASATSPILTSGYAYKSYVAAVYNNASRNFDTFALMGDYILNGTAQVLAGGTQTSYTSISLATVVPTTARSFIYSVQGGTAAKTSWIASDSSGVYYQRLYWDNVNQLLLGNQEMLLLTPQTMWYKVASGGSLTLDVIGYRF